jgi:hypothetical protein
MDAGQKVAGMTSATERKPAGKTAGVAEAME